jgi:very-short-patch-repair endonuclease
MPRELTPLDTDNLIARYRAGESLSRLCHEAGLRQGQLRKRLVAAGLVLDARGVRRRIRLDEGRVVADYVAGASEKKLADELGISRRAIRRVLTTHGVEIRSRSDAELLKWSVLKRDRAAVERQCGRAWDAARVRVHGADELALRAQTHYTRGSRLIGRFELATAAILTENGLAFESQWPEGSYNIDFALHESRIAVEVLGTIVTHAARDRIRERTEHLLNRGWCVLFVYVGPLWGGRRVVPDVGFVAEQIVALAERAGRGEPVHGRYRVIRGDGKPTTMLRRYLNDLPVV